MGVSPNDLKVIRMYIERVIKPSENLRGEHISYAALPIMDDPKLLAGTVLYNSYVSPQTLDESCIVLKNNTDIISEVDHNSTFDSFYFKFHEDEESWEQVEYLNGNYVNCTFDMVDAHENSGILFEGCKISNLNLKGIRSGALSNCLIQGTLDVYSSFEYTSGFRQYQLEVEDCNIVMGSTDDMFIDIKGTCAFRVCLSNIDLSMDGNTHRCLILKDDVSVIDQVGADTHLYTSMLDFDWPVRNSDLRHLHLRLDYDRMVNSANFKGSVFGTTHSDTRIATFFSFKGWSAYAGKPMHDEEYGYIDVEPFRGLFENVNFSDTLFNNVYINALSYEQYGGLHPYRDGKLPAFEDCDFSNSFIGFVAYTNSSNQEYHKNRYVEFDPKSVKFKNCNFEGCISFRRKEVGRKGGYYFGRKCEYTNLNLQGRKMLGNEFELATITNSNMKGCTWYSHLTFAGSNFEGCDFSNLKMDPFIFFENKVHLNAFGSNLRGCDFRGLPKGFVMRLLDCKTEGMLLDSNIEKYTDDLERTIIKVV